MKKFALAFAGVVVGCVVGAVVPRVVAQTATPASSPQRWEQFCEMKGGIGNGDARARALDRMNGSLGDQGRQGWELVATPVFTMGGGTQTNWSEVMFCYRRPAP